MEINSNSYNKSVARVIRAIRVVRLKKQFVLSESLHIDRGNYSRMECGIVSINITNLKLISICLDVSISEIIVIADADEKIKFNSLSGEEIINHLKNGEKHNKTFISLSETDLQQVIFNIKKFYCIEESTPLI